MSTLNTTNIKHAGNTGDANLVLASDGTSTFNDDVTIDGDLSAAAGTFSGDVTSNVFYRTQPSGDPFGNILVSQLDGQDRLRIRADGEIAIGTTNIGNTPGINFLVTPDGTTKIGGSVATSPNITLAADGTIGCGRSDFSNGYAWTKIEPSQITINRPTASGHCLKAGWGGVPNITLSANGSALFGGLVTFSGGTSGVTGRAIELNGEISIQLEPDDPANYTTTMVDGEEQQVYTGPTLDVKEKLLQFVARIEALEAANASLEARLTALEGGN